MFFFILAKISRKDRVVEISFGLYMSIAETPLISLCRPVLFYYLVAQFGGTTKLVATNLVALDGEEEWYFVWLWMLFGDQFDDLDRLDA